MSEFIEEPVNHNEINFTPRINEVAQKFLADLEKERDRLEGNFPLINLILEETFDRVYSTGRIPGKEFYADVYKQKPLKIAQKVFVPVKQYPKFNFTGKILGPKGNSLRRLQEETQCRIMIKGRNSMRDRNKEEELRNANEPRYAHLNKDLFLEITAVATPAEAYARVAYALAEIRKYLVPDKNDDVSHDQLRELMEIDPSAVKIGQNAPHMSKSVFEKKIGSKHTGYLEDNHADKEPEIHKMVFGEAAHYSLKRDAQPEYESARISSYKRSPVGGYAANIKRLRESSDTRESGVGKTIPFKQNAYSILKKYK